MAFCAADYYVKGGTLYKEYLIYSTIKIFSKFDHCFQRWRPMSDDWIKI